MKEESIRKLYAELESKSDLKELPYKKIQDESLSEKERIVLQKEWWILSDYATRCDNVHNQEEIVTYAKERVASTSNIFLLARYNHVLYNLTKKGENCKGGSGARGILSTSRRNSPAHIVVAAERFHAFSERFYTDLQFLLKK